ncbi:MAG: hypothetical protein F9B45_20670 [Phycisphaera sp. RhM]|nr:hypothetical protein [Phycisphaera sp. RhM]
MDASSEGFDLASDLLAFQTARSDVTATNSRWHDPSTLVIEFEAQPTSEPVYVELSASITNTSGFPLDQDQDGIGGEAVDDRYVAEMKADRRGPHVFLTQPETVASAPLEKITLHFSEPIDISSFSVDDITEFMGPKGDLLSQITGVIAENAQATVFFDSQIDSGEYQITIGPMISDVVGNLLDQNQDGQLGQVDDTFTATIQLMSADLAVTSVADPVAATYGDELDLTWTVTNEGTDPASGLWWDYVYLSADTTWDLNDALVAKVPYDAGARGNIAGNGGSYEGSITAAMPAVLPGNYHVLVRTNILSTIAETDKSDNVLTSTATASFDLPVLADATPVTVDVNYRDTLHYQIDIPESVRGGSILLKFGTDNSAVANELYLRKDALPTRADHDRRSQQGLSSSQYLILSNVEPGTWYALAATAPNASRTDILGTATIQVEFLVPGEYSVFDSYFGLGGTAGNRTIEVNGANFDRSLEVVLSNGTSVVSAAISYYRPSAEKLYATFDLTAVDPGAYGMCQRQ